MKGSCDKYEEWGDGFVLLVVSLMVLWLIAGFWLTSLSGTLPALIFLALAFGSCFSAFYLTCRYCPYYGKKCYLGFGLLVPFFARREEGPAPGSYFALWTASFLLALVYPPAILFVNHRVSTALVYVAVYLAAPLAALVLVSRYACPHCRNTGCPANPDRKKGAASALTRE